MPLTAEQGRAIIFDGKDTQMTEAGYFAHEPFPPNCPMGMLIVPVSTLGRTKRVVSM